ncbi:MAG: tRNA (guanosine(37)-N1)-methyltransferase TrmD [Nitrospinae bacterium CG11_big_fil_rev_8_21_14_0_20_56_8]|nr:MAG: tRNA (guanosine(37)-N1)-methyltransferase TrmD [Nitrospinae bacterium CG11_big_fil_rev_8_21_14_0_20_56_8]
MAIRFDVITIFPGMFESPMSETLLKRARDAGLLEVRTHNLRDYTLSKHKNVDDTPYGGGVGMVMNVEPIVRAIEAVKQDRPGARVVLMSPCGNRFDHAHARELARNENIVLVCGRYEGVDDRVRHFIDEEISIGDYILSGGELPAMVVIEAVSRFVPGVLGDHESLAEESFASHILEYPQYTRPREFRGYPVPEVLVSGDHKKIKAWQRQEALKLTARLRPDLLKHSELSEQDRKILKQIDVG